MGASSSHALSSYMLLYSIDGENSKQLQNAIVDEKVVKRIALSASKSLLPIYAKSLYLKSVSKTRLSSLPTFI